MNYPIFTEKRKQSWLQWLENPNEKYRAFIILDDGEKASFYGKTEEEAKKQAENYRKHYLK